MTDPAASPPTLALDHPAALAVTGAVVVTADEAATVHDPGMVVVDGGELAYVGPPVAVEAAETIDAGGAICLPGLVNAHTHLAMTLYRGLADDLDLDGFLGRLMPAEAATLTPDTVAAGTELAVAECLLGGITAALDMYWFPEAAFEVADRAGFRLHAGPVFLEFEGPDATPFDRRLAWAERWLARAGEHLGSTAWLQPHSTYLLSEPQLRAIGDLAAAAGAGVHVHAAETRAELEQVRARHGRTPVQVLADTGLLGPRTVLAHAVHLDDTDIRLVAEAGAAVAHNPASNLKLASGVARVPDLLAAGVTVALGTDGPPAGNDLDLWLAMRLAAYTQKVHHGAATLPAADVVRMATAAGAAALGGAGGVLAAGAPADLVVLDAASPSLTPTFDPHSAAAFAAGRGDVRHVVVGGRVVVRDRRLTFLDVEEAAARVRALRPRILAAVG